MSKRKLTAEEIKEKLIRIERKVAEDVMSDFAMNARARHSELCDAWKKLTGRNWRWHGGRIR